MTDFYYLIISFFFIIAFFLLIFLAFNKQEVVQYLVFFWFGSGIGALLFNLNLEIYLGGLRLESWVWFSTFILLILGILKAPNLKKSIKYLFNSNFVFYLGYILFLFLGLLRSPSLADGFGSFIVKLFPLIAALHFISIKGDFYFFKKLIYFSVFVNIVIASIYFGLGFPIIQADYTGSLRLTGSMGWASFAYFLMFPFSLFFIKWLEKPDLLNLFLFVLFLVLILFTISRTGLIMVFLIIMVLFSTFKKGKFIFLNLAFVVFIVLSPFIYNQFYNKFFYQATGVGIATSGRLTSIEYLFDFYIKDLFNMFFGVGTSVSRQSLGELEQFGIQSIHSAFAETFFDLGLVGFLFFSVFCFKFLFNFWKYSRNFNLKYPFGNRTDKYFIICILLGLACSIMLIPLAMFDNLYNPFHTSVIFIAIMSTDFYVKNFVSIRKN